MGMILIAGRELYSDLQVEKEAVVPKSSLPGREQCHDSETLCRLQQKRARAGIVGVQLVKSIYGWSVRYDSGIQNFGIVAGARSGILDGTIENAIDYAQKWVSDDPERRYAWVSDIETSTPLERDDIAIAVSRSKLVLN